jgi:hypothetical protein
MPELLEFGHLFCIFAPKIDSKKQFLTMKILKRHYEKPTMQVYELRETPKILADSGGGGLNDYNVPSGPGSPGNPLNW